MAKLPERTADTMSDVIALTSPDGRMSKRAIKRDQEVTRLKLFGPGGLANPKSMPQDLKTVLLRRAAELRGLASRGMSVRRYTKEAARLEKQAAEL